MMDAIRLVFISHTRSCRLAQLRDLLRLGSLGRRLPRVVTRDSVSRFSAIILTRYALNSLRLRNRVTKRTINRAGNAAGTTTGTA